MPECLHCGESINYPFRCNYCGAEYCKKHRLPENHDCDAIDFISPPGEPAFLPIQKYREWRRRRHRERIDDAQPANLSEHRQRQLESRKHHKKRDPNRKPSHEQEQNRKTDETRFDTPQPIQPKYTVGTPPDPEYDKPPEVELKPTKKPIEPSSSFFKHIAMEHRVKFVLLVLGLLLLTILFAYYGTGTL